MQWIPLKCIKNTYKDKVNTASIHQQGRWIVLVRIIEDEENNKLTKESNKDLNIISAEEKNDKQEQLSFIDLYERNPRESEELILCKTQEVPFIVQMIEWHPIAIKLICMGPNSEVFLWDPWQDIRILCKEGKKKVQDEDSMWIEKISLKCITWHPTQILFSAVVDDAQLWIWDENGTCIQQIKVNDQPLTSYNISRAIAWHPFGHLIAISLENQIEILSYPEGKLIYKIPLPNTNILGAPDQCEMLIWNKKGDMIIMIGSNYGVSVFEIPSLDMKFQFSLKYQYQQRTRGTYIRNNFYFGANNELEQSLAVGGEMGRICLLDRKNWNLIAIISPPIIESPQEEWLGVYYLQEIQSSPNYLIFYRNIGLYLLDIAHSDTFSNHFLPLVLEEFDAYNSNKIFKYFPYICFFTPDYPIQSRIYPELLPVPPINTAVYWDKEKASVNYISFSFPQDEGYCSYLSFTGAPIFFNPLRTAFLWIYENTLQVYSFPKLQKMDELNFDGIYSNLFYAEWSPSNQEFLVHFHTFVNREIQEYLLFWKAQTHQWTRISENSYSHLIETYLYWTQHWSRSWCEHTTKEDPSTFKPALIHFKDHTPEYDHFHPYFQISYDEKDEEFDYRWNKNTKTFEELKKEPLEFDEVDDDYIWESDSYVWDIALSEDLGYFRILWFHLQKKILLCFFSAIGIIDNSTFKFTIIKRLPKLLHIVDPSLSPTDDLLLFHNHVRTSTSDCNKYSIFLYDLIHDQFSEILPSVLVKSPLLLEWLGFGEYIVVGYADTNKMGIYSPTGELMRELDFGANTINAIILLSDRWTVDVIQQNNHIILDLQKSIPTVKK